MRLFLLLLFCVFFADSCFGEIKVKLPKKWEQTGRIIYHNKKKVGELISKNEVYYDTGEQFIKSFKDGFADDPKSTQFISSGIEGNVYWICRRTEYEGANGDAGFWYARRFWSNGTILTLYSHVSCSDKLKESIEIAKTLIENDKLN